MQSELTSYAELGLGVVGIILALYERTKRRTDREEFHRQLIVLKPSIQGENKEEVIRAINETLVWLKPHKKK
jgi:hypothetical protein